MSESPPPPLLSDFIEGCTACIQFVNTPVGFTPECFCIVLLHLATAIDLGCSQKKRVKRVLVREVGNVSKLHLDIPYSPVYGNLTQQNRYELRVYILLIMKIHKIIGSHPSPPPPPRAVGLFEGCTDSPGPASNL